MSDDPMFDIVRAMTRDLTVLEVACERALQLGSYGVLAIRDRDTHELLAAEPDSSVPYGHIYETFIDLPERRGDRAVGSAS